MDHHGVATVIAPHEAAAQEVRLPIQSPPGRPHLVQCQSSLDDVEHVAAHDWRDGPIRDTGPLVLRQLHAACASGAGDALVAFAEGVRLADIGRVVEDLANDDEVPELSAARCGDAVVAQRRCAGRRRPGRG
jgi:hypothetical protein